MTDGPAGRGARPPRGLWAAIALTALLALYAWAIVGRGMALIGTGSVAGVLIGVAVLVLPLLCIVLIVCEWLLAATVQRMADTLAAAGELPVDDLPRSPGGRIDRAAADAAFAPVRERVEADPEDWRAHYHLAFAYDAAGDRRQARASLREAARLFRAGARG